MTIDNKIKALQKHAVKVSNRLNEEHIKSDSKDANASEYQETAKVLRSIVNNTEKIRKTVCQQIFECIAKELKEKFPQFDCVYKYERLTVLTAARNGYSKTIGSIGINAKDELYFHRWFNHPKFYKTNIQDYCDKLRTYYYDVAPKNVIIRKLKIKHDIDVINEAYDVLKEEIDYQKQLYKTNMIEYKYYNRDVNALCKHLKQQGYVITRDKNF